MKQEYGPNRRQGGHPLEMHDYSKAKELYEMGYSVIDIGKVIGVCPGSVYKWLIRRYPEIIRRKGGNYTSAPRNVRPPIEEAVDGL